LQRLNYGSEKTDSRENNIRLESDSFLLFLRNHNKISNGK